MATIILVLNVPIKTGTYLTVRFRGTCYNPAYFKNPFDQIYNAVTDDKSQKAKKEPTSEPSCHIISFLSYISD